MVWFMFQVRMKLLLLLFALTNVAVAQVTVQQIDPLLNVLPNRTTLQSYSITHPAAIGETFTIQLFLKNNTNKNEEVTLSFTSATVPAKDLSAFKYL